MKSPETPEVNVIALVKGAERYVFLFTDSNLAGMLRIFGTFAANPDLSFTWYDAAVLSQRVRHTQTANQADCDAATRQSKCTKPR